MLIKENKQTTSYSHFTFFYYIIGTKSSLHLMVRICTRHAKTLPEHSTKISTTPMQKNLGMNVDHIIINKILCCVALLRDALMLLLFWCYCAA
jgi:hypothetical protein